jgi:8-oxo-dGTP diphosphatase
MSGPARIVVTAAVIKRDGRYLVTRRIKGTHLAGMWEFPGGKREPGETLEASLIREIQEELGADAVVRHLLLMARHDYDTRSVELHFFACDLTSEPQPRLGQEIRWVTPEEIGTLEFPPADAELIELLKQG